MLGGIAYGHPPALFKIGQKKKATDELLKKRHRPPKKLSVEKRNEGIIMSKKLRSWYYNPPKPPKQKVDEFAKEGIKKKCDKFIESVLKPRFISSEQSALDELYVTDIYSKLWRNYIYFYAIYQDTRPRAIEPTFDLKLARIEYLEEDKYNLAYFRHTGKWWVIFYEIPLEECFEAIEDMPHFHP